MMGQWFTSAGRLVLHSDLLCLRTYSVDGKHFIRLLFFGLVAWSPAMAGLFLLASGAASPGAASLVGLAGGISVGVLSLGRSLEKKEPVLRFSDTPYREQRWANVGNPKAIHANRWAMYQSLSEWLSARDWRGKKIGEIGGSNGVLRSFVAEGQYVQLVYPEYDVENLKQIHDSEFDLMILDQILEHLPDPERALREVRRVVKPDGVAIITTPFLVPVHTGPNFGDYYRWTPQGMIAMLKRNGFEANVRMWGNLEAAKALTDDMYLMADNAFHHGLDLSSSDSSGQFPITVWAIARVNNHSVDI